MPPLSHGQKCRAKRANSGHTRADLTEMQVINAREPGPVAPPCDYCRLRQSIQQNEQIFTNARFAKTVPNCINLSNRCLTATGCNPALVHRLLATRRFAWQLFWPDRRHAIRSGGNLRTPVAAIVSETQRRHLPDPIRRPFRHEVAPPAAQSTAQFPHSGCYAGAAARSAGRSIHVLPRGCLVPCPSP